MYLWYNDLLRSLELWSCGERELHIQKGISIIHNIEININILNLNFVNTEINIEIHLISVPNPGSMHFKVNMRVSLLSNALNMHIRDSNL